MKRKDTLINCGFGIWRKVLVACCAIFVSVFSPSYAACYEPVNSKDADSATIASTDVSDADSFQDSNRLLILKSNALAVAGALMANAGVEVELFPRWSLDLPFYYSPYNLFKETRKLRVLAVQPEVRYWLGAVSSGHFVGLHAHIGSFNVALNDHGRYQDAGSPLWGMGVSYGYVMSFGESRRWGMELNIGAGFADYSYNRYSNIGGVDENRWLEYGKKRYWGITRASVSFSYKFSLSKKTNK